MTVFAAALDRIFGDVRFEDLWIQFLCTATDLTSATGTTHRRGRHKVFIGMAPGVGKTCRMLQEGKEMLREGTDVVVGLLAKGKAKKDTSGFVVDPDMIAVGG